MVNEERETEPYEPSSKGVHAVDEGLVLLGGDTDAVEDHAQAVSDNARARPLALNCQGHVHAEATKVRASREEFF